MWKARLKARRSRYSLARRLTHSVPAMAGLATLLVALIVASVAVVRIELFFTRVTGKLVNPIAILPHVGAAIGPPGSISWKLHHGQDVHILLLGYPGGNHINDAPLLTDSIMVATLDPPTGKVALASVPRDMWVSIDPYPQGQGPIHDKINSAFEYGTENLQGKLARYTGRDGGGHLAESVVGAVTGISFDGYIAVDFQAFRDLVNAVGGVSVSLPQPLHDCHYPNYGDGYLNHGVPVGGNCPSPTAGIYFPAGTQTLNGERALELARSRHADNPAQATDFGRAQRQQMIISAIKDRALSVGGIAKLPAVLSAIESNIKTDLSIDDIQAVYDFGGHLPPGRILHLALTDQDLLTAYFDRGGSCGPYNTYVLCPTDPSYQTIRHFFANEFVPVPTLSQGAPVRVEEATWTDYGIQSSVSSMLQELGFKVGPAGRTAHSQGNVVYDYSGGRYAATAQWLASYFGGSVVTPAPPAPATPAAQASPASSGGVVVVLGTKFGLSWFGQVG
ncbi:MAG: LCP family protein [Candidatus Dormibacterales bacterium]